MAAFTDIATLQFQGHTASGQATRNTLHFRRNPSAGQVDATWLTAWLADSNTTALQTAYLKLFRTAGRLDGILARAERDPLNPNDDRDEAFKVVDLAGTGSAASTSSPDEAGVILKLNGDLAGRRFRGRIWLPPINDNGSIAGELAAGSYVTNADLLRDELVKTTYPSGASHYGGQWNDVDLVVFSRRGRSLDERYYARVSGISVPRKIHWLRSRNPTLA